MISGYLSDEIVACVHPGPGIIKFKLGLFISFRQGGCFPPPPYQGLVILFIFFKKVAFKIWMGFGGYCIIGIGGPHKGCSAGIKIVIGE